MPQDQWTAVDRYITETLVPPDDALDAALQASVDAGLPPIHVAANQGKLLSILAQSIGARAILEIGTLGGYSTIWLARSLPAGGRLITLEIDPEHARIARDNIARARLSAGATLDTYNSAGAVADPSGPSPTVRATPTGRWVWSLLR